MHEAGQSRKLTYADYCALPDDGQRYEIIEGELFVSPSPVAKHQRSVLNLAYALETYLRQNPLGVLFVAPFDVVLDDHNVVVPDLVYVSRESRALTEKNVQGAPDLVIEILSPSTARVDRVRKMNSFASHGVPHYWLVDPAVETLEAFVLEGGSYRLAAAVDAQGAFEPALFPGLRIEIAKLFA